MALSFRSCLVGLSFSLYVTEGAVTIDSAPYSWSNRWQNTSMCSKPRKPNLQPWPKAGLIQVSIISNVLLMLSVKCVYTHFINSITKMNIHRYLQFYKKIEKQHEVLKRVLKFCLVQLLILDKHKVWIYIIKRSPVDSFIPNSDYLSWKICRIFGFMNTFNYSRTVKNWYKTIVKKNFKKRKSIINVLNDLGQAAK